MSTRRQRFAEIFDSEVTKISDERLDIPGYKQALRDALYKTLDREKMRIDHDASSGGILVEIKDIVNNLGNFIEDAR